MALSAVHGIGLFKIETPGRNFSFTTVISWFGGAAARCPRQNGVEIIVRVVAIALVAALAALPAVSQDAVVGSGIGYVGKPWP